MTGLVLDLFAGPGGWSTGLRAAGYTGPAVGIEWDLTACRTAQAAGHQRICADVAAYPVEVVSAVTGLVGSPPCPSFSVAGTGAGKLDELLVHERIRAFAHEQQPPRREWADVRSQLTAEPMRWAVALWPRWIALEQVPPVLPLWRRTAALLRERGYRVWCGILSAETYGVPQTRKRAILIASLDAPVGPPAPTHQPYRAGVAPEVEPTLFGAALPSPVSIAQALGWGAGTIFYGQRGVLRGSSQANGTERQLNQPASTVYSSRAGNLRWHARITPPGHRDRAGGEPQPGPETTRVTVREAATLQGFPPDYPWRGTTTQQYQQIGNAIPPPLAEAILRPLLATTRERAGSPIRGMSS